MTAILVFLAGALIATAAAGTGGWWLRGQWDRCRAEVARDRVWDKSLAVAAQEREDEGTARA